MSTVARHIIMAIHVTDRMQRVGALQQALSEFGCYIKTRLGLHEATADFCSQNGLIILEMLDDKEKMQELKEKVNSIEGLEAKEIIFEHE